MVEIIFDENEDWEKRILCGDESCIGTIGPDGKCRECGKVYPGEIPEDPGSGSAPAVIAGNIETVVPDNPGIPQDAACDDDWEKRVLCSDEACIGVIGSDGKCKECGKPG